MKVTKLDNIHVVCSALGNTLYLARFGKQSQRDKELDVMIALEKRPIEYEVMNSLTQHMMEDAPKGASKTYMLKDKYYKITIEPSCKETFEKQ